MRGRELALGLAFAQTGVASKVSRDAIEHRLLIGTSDPHDAAVELLPPLNVGPDQLDEAVDILAISAKSQSLS